MSSQSYQIKTMSLAEVKLAIDLAAAEGWNPGLHDTECFYATTIALKRQRLFKNSVTYLVLDDLSLDKQSAKYIELVYRHWSDKQHKTVQGINLLMLCWTDDDKQILCD